MKARRLVSLLIAISFLLTPLAGCWQPSTDHPTPVINQQGNNPVVEPVDEPIDGYLAVAPKTLRTGQTEALSVSLFNRQRPANSTVRFALLQDGERVAETEGYVRGQGDVLLNVPKLSDGDYQLQFNSQGLQSQSTVRVEDGTLVFVETDKPIYKPGQPIHIRVVTLDPELKPVQGSVTVDVADAKGTKVFKKEVTTDEYGMASLEMPLSSEPNLGVWKISAKAGNRATQIDVRVERYVLPKYEVGIDLAKDWVLANESLTGTISAEYSYGKPVQGEVEIRASRYVGAWEEYAEVTKNIDGKIDFQLPPVQYVSGVPAAGGMGNVTLEVTVREKSTGYEEKTTKLLTVAASPVTLRMIPESVAFKPSLPLSVLVVAETPDKQAVDADVQLEVAYTKSDFQTTRESRNVQVKQGQGMVQLSPPADAISLTINAHTGEASSSLYLQSGYSPTGSFILVEPTGSATLKPGDTASFKVTSTWQANNFYYEVLARGKVVFSDFTSSPEIAFTVTPMMAPEARLLVYQILPNSEVAADYIPFSVDGNYPHQVQVAFGAEEVKPGDKVDVNVKTAGQARVGLVAVDKSVFILAENRLNLQQVFAELETLYQKPQVELHEARPIGTTLTRGATDVFADAGVIVLSNKQVPDGKEYSDPRREMWKMMGDGAAAMPAAGNMAIEDARAPAAAPMPQATASASDANQSNNLAEVQRVRQFFPETWIWTDLTTDSAGQATKQFEAPDSITTWMLRAVALSKQTGLGISEAQLRVLQPFFVQIDLPYSAIRGEEFPVKVALYNYTTQAEEFIVDLDRADWFELLDDSSKTVKVEPNSVAGASFTIRPGKLGVKQVKVTARSQNEADAIIKDIIIEPEGVPREEVENLVVSAGSIHEVNTSFPNDVIEGSDRAYLAITGNYLTQTIEGLEKLIQMPFGCGEQNMILFAPNVSISRYLKETSQMKPEIMAKAENMMITGYQRELTYRRGDGSFSTFGESDEIGSLWLTAFVLKTFAQAKDVIYVDDAVLAEAKSWIANHQKADGSFEPVGFVHHQEILGGMKGNTALTAYLAVALKEAGEEEASSRAVRYLEGALDRIDDVYSLALSAYALELAESPKADAAHEKLMSKAQDSDEGLYWADEQDRPIPLPKPLGPGEMAPRQEIIGLPQPNRSAAIETTAYATLALIEHGDRLSAGRAAQWLVSNRNAYGGFGSTQDTVVGLQALTAYAVGAKSDVDATVTLKSGDWQKEVRVAPENADVLQVIDVPSGGTVVVETQGKGQVVVQAVRRFNIPEPAEKSQSAFQIDVNYGTDQVEVNDLIDIKARVRFTPPMPLEAGMVVLDLAIPTGFAAEADTLARLVEEQPKVKRYEVSGRKVILYIKDMMPDEELQFSFQARALYPVKAQPVTSQVYSYYRPDWNGESLGGALVVASDS